jgi:hypothetical protein
MLRSPAIASPFILLGATGWVACGSGSGGGAGATGCPSEMGGSLAGAVPVQGGVTGPSVSAQICPNGEFAVLEDGAGETTDPFVLHLDTATSPFGTNYRYIAFQDPANSVSGNIEAVMGATAASPGTYNSSDGACGLLTVCAYLSPAGSRCEDAGAPTCSLGRCYQAQGVKSCDRSASASQTSQDKFS